jgi:hypothetical protein
MWIEAALANAVDAEEGAAPARFALLPPAPNPSSGRTALRFTLPEAGEATLAVYDLLGRRVALLADGAHPPGEHVAVWDADGAAPGLYVARLIGGQGEHTQRVTVVR